MNHSLWGYFFVPDILSFQRSVSSSPSCVGKPVRTWKRGIYIVSLSTHKYRANGAEMFMCAHVCVLYVSSQIAVYTCSKVPRRRGKLSKNITHEDKNRRSSNCVIIHQYDYNISHTEVVNPILKSNEISKQKKKRSRGRSADERLGGCEVWQMLSARWSRGFDGLGSPGAHDRQRQTTGSVVSTTELDYETLWKCGAARMQKPDRCRCRAVAGKLDCCIHFMVICIQ